MSIERVLFWLNPDRVQRECFLFYVDWYRPKAYDNYLREPLKIHFGGQVNLFDSGRRQGKAALATAKADFPSLPGIKNLHLAAQKQLLELP